MGCCGVYVAASLFRRRFLPLIALVAAAVALVSLVAARDHYQSLDVQSGVTGGATGWFQLAILVAAVWFVASLLLLLGARGVPTVVRQVVEFFGSLNLGKLAGIAAAVVSIGAGIYLLTSESASEQTTVFDALMHGIGAYFIARGLWMITKMARSFDAPATAEREATNPPPQVSQAPSAAPPTDSL